VTHKAQQWWLGFQVGCTYIGTVVGAGFASGQEIFQFFGRFGNWGYVAVGITVFLFAWLGYRVMLLGHQLKARSYHELNVYLFGGRVAMIVDAVILFMLFGVTVAMLAGAGELFHERMHISFQVGAMLTMLFTFLTILKGMTGILRANTVIVPIMVSFVLYAAVHALLHRGLQTAWTSGHFLISGHPVMTGLSAVIYAAFNIGLAAGVLIPLGADMTDTSVLRRGARLGSMGLGVMLLAVMFTLFAHYPNVLSFAVPMGYVASQLGHWIQWVFVFVLWGEIYSSLVGNVFAMTSQLHPRNRAQFTMTTAIILIIAYAASQVGFSTIITYAYTLFGWVSTMLLMALLWPRSDLPEL
jgi:uncharacterized membrane protein YkvI